MNNNIINTKYLGQRLGLAYYLDEITKEWFDALNTMDKGKAEFLHCGECAVCGYGVYSFKVYEKDGKFFVSYCQGTSCD